MEHLGKTALQHLVSVNRIYYIIIVHVTVNYSNH